MSEELGIEKNVTPKQLDDPAVFAEKADRVSSDQSELTYLHSLFDYIAQVIANSIFKDQQGGSS